MREIKFRAWDKVQARMFDDKIVMPRCDLGNLLSNKAIYKYWAVMQYTGLEDRNGKEIYVGDIIKSDWYEGKQRITCAKVVFSSGRFTCTNLNFDLYLFPELEVIGNIYEHGHLLGK